MLVPDFKWAQTTEMLYVTIELVDAKDVKVVIDNKRLTFSGVAKGSTYALDVELSGEINAAESKFSVQPRGVALVLVKADQASEFWGHLVADHKAWKAHCHIDWARWVDEDDEEEADPNADWKKQSDAYDPVQFGGGDGAGGFDMSQFAAMQEAMKGQGGDGAAGFDMSQLEGLAKSMGGDNNQ